MTKNGTQAVYLLN